MISRSDSIRRFAAKEIFPPSDLRNNEALMCLDANQRRRVDNLPTGFLAFDVSDKAACVWLRLDVD